MIFPVICPVCGADSGRRVIPASPEVETFHCGDCHREWSEPAPPLMPLPPAGRAPLLDRFWQRLRHT
jgi:hypothetical protein